MDRMEVAESMQGSGWNALLAGSPVPLVVSIDDIQEAALRIRDYVAPTPLLESPALNERLGFRLLVKAEALQHTRSFKVRGAFNQLLQLTEQEKACGVVAISSGNHAQAVAYAAKILGIHATIVMPQDAPRIKLEATRSYGAEIVLYNRNTDDREAIGATLAREKGGARLVHPYNDPRTIAGQGTVGLEIFTQSSALGIAPDAIIVNCGGGSLTSGIASTRVLYSRPPQIFTAEPAEFNDAQRSLADGQLHKNSRKEGSICDALLTYCLGENTLPILLAHGAIGLTASDAEVEEAMRLAQAHFNLRLEPGGAVSLACATLQRERLKGKIVVAVASGGNVDPEMYNAVLQHSLIPAL